MKRTTSRLLTLAVSLLLAVTGVFVTQTFVTQTPAHATSLLDNPGFESGALPPWTCAGALGSVTDSPVRSGMKALAAAAGGSDGTVLREDGMDSTVKAATPAEMCQAKAAGLTILMSIGGATAGIDLSSSAVADRFVAAVVPILKKFDWALARSCPSHPGRDTDDAAHAAVRARGQAAGLLPAERPYPLPPDLARAVGATADDTGPAPARTPPDGAQWTRVSPDGTADPHGERGP